MLQQITLECAPGVQVIDDLESKVRINGRRAEADQHRKVMRVTRSTGLDNNIAIATQIILDKPLVNGTGSQGCLHGNLARYDITIGQYNNDPVFSHGL